MAKKAKYKKYHTASPKVPKVEEPVVEYKSLKKASTVMDFSYRKFEKIAALVPFTQKEWANILNLSERTLQRYSNGNSSFEGIYVDRILHVEELILNFESLYSTRGIQDIIDELGRIQHGVYI